MRNRRTMIALVSFLAINASVLVCAKNVEAVSRPEQIVGTWSLVSIYEEDAGGEDVDSFGANPEGHLVLDRSGHFSLEIFGERRKSAAHSQVIRTSADAQSLLQSSLAYFGTYSIGEDSGSLTLTVQRSLFPNLDNAVLQSSITLSATSLELESAGALTPTGAAYSHLRWRRVAD
jgi:hypothetical protein